MSLFVETLDPLWCRIAIEVDSGGGADQPLSTQMKHHETSESRWGFAEAKESQGGTGLLLPSLSALVLEIN